MVGIDVLDLRNSTGANGFTLSLSAVTDEVVIDSVIMGADSRLAFDSFTTSRLAPFDLTITGPNARMALDPKVDVSVAGHNLALLLPADIENGDIMLDVTGLPLNITGSAVMLQTAGEPRQLRNGDVVTLISSTTGAIANPGEQKFLYGATEYIFDVQSDIALLATFLVAEVEESYAKAYLEGSLASLATLNLGQDLILTQALPLTLSYTADKIGLTPFAAFGAASQRINSGSHIDVDGYATLGGLAFGFNNALGRSIFGAFVEGGWGNSSTYNNFSTARIKGDTTSDYFGGGFLARHNFAAGSASYPYIDVSFRGGRVNTDFKSGDMGIGAKYDSSAAYFGSHAGLGVLWSLYEGGVLDTYAQFLWTRQGGDKTTTDAGEKLKFNAANSLRTRLGVRLNHDLSGALGLFAGGGWEHEYDGRLTAKLSDVNVAAPQMRGSSGYVELGVDISMFDAISVKAAGQGYLGQREGISGSLGLAVSF